MNNIYNIAAISDRSIYKTKEELINSIGNIKDYILYKLSDKHYKDSKRDLILLSNCEGWCTMYCITTQRIIQGYASDFIY